MARLGRWPGAIAPLGTVARNVREVEAESVTLLVLGTMGESGLEYCRGYVQHWLRGQSIDERTAQRIFKAADTILRAGRIDQAQTVDIAA